jgi:hypothetical protein
MLKLLLSLLPPHLRPKQQPECEHDWDLYAYTTKPLVMQGTGWVDQHRVAYATKKCKCRNCGTYETFVVD